MTSELIKLTTLRFANFLESFSTATTKKCIIMPHLKTQVSQSNIDYVIKCLGECGIQVYDFSADLSKYSFYSEWPGNEHHFTTMTCYDVILPKISELLDIDINLTDYVKHYVHGHQFEVSYYESPYGNKFDYFDIGLTGNPTGQTHFTGDSSILRALSIVEHNDIYFSDYHKLFRGSHHNCLVVNHTVKPKKLLIITDSMTIPIMPILADHYSEILHIDNRHHNQVNKWMKMFKPDQILVSHIRPVWDSSIYIDEMLI